MIMNYQMILYDFLHKGNDLDEADLESRYTVQAYEYAIGDVSFHHGWCLHHAPENIGSETR